MNEPAVGTTTRPAPAGPSRAAADRPTLSFELFPPRDIDNAPRTWETVRALEAVHPDFVSVTYGASGRTRTTSRALVSRILRETTLTPIAHLTCVGTSRDEVTTIVGEGLFTFGYADGVGGSVRLQHPLGVLHRDGLIYVADTYNNRIRMLNPAARRVTTLVGSGSRGAKDGIATEAELNEPSGLAWGNGRLYIADTNNHAIRRNNCNQECKKRDDSPFASWSLTLRWTHCPCHAAGDRTAL